MEIPMLRIFITVLIVLCSIQAFGSKHSVGSQRFENEILNYLYTCDTACQKEYREEPLFIEGRKVSAFMKNGVLKKLNKIATKQANIWNDTILAGDYFSTGKTELMSVYGIFYRTRLVAYKIIYFENAWDISNCDFIAEFFAVSPMLDACEKGIIRESSFVSPDLMNYIRNYSEIAEFEALH